MVDGQGLEGERRLLRDDPRGIQAPPGFPRFMRAGARAGAGRGRGTQ